VITRRCALSVFCLYVGRFGFEPTISYSYACAFSKGKQKESNRDGMETVDNETEEDLDDTAEADEADRRRPGNEYQKDGFVV